MVNLPDSNYKNTNWRYLLIVTIFAIVVGGGALGYGWLNMPEETEIPKIRTLKKETTQVEETASTAIECINSGGKLLELYECKPTPADFPNTCFVGKNPIVQQSACGDPSRQRVEFCDCGVNKCFNGSKCVSSIFPEDSSVSVVTVATDQEKYEYKWDDGWVKGDTIKITVKNNSDKTVCFTNTKPYYIERADVQEDSYSQKTPDLIRNRIFIAECINKQEVKIFQKDITENDLYSPQGSYRIKIPIYIESPIKDFYRIGKIVSSNTFSINAKENPNKVPDDLKNILLEEAKKLASFWGCFEPPIITIENFYYSSRVIDLNDDGSKEFIIEPSSITDTSKEGYYCSVRGASGNGPFLIFQKIDGDWWNIGELNGNMINIEKTKTNEYFDITTYWHLGAGHGEINFYQWQDSARNYELKKSEKKVFE